ncbi:hypothetical protein CTEN210_13684 [Chaetoceros tenuissimus]|uniref:Leucine-rich repeat domain-containing protein n=1 Tax=Chaetoceros tenuissimus TaxID=426638 RepID=A0AAD3D3S1_9STRA|nr:hypothetical protein CTEN210_13684 [Chaetoceros tenuissimus]
MRIATVDGLVTVFYEGSKPLYNELLEEELSHAHQQNLDPSEECKEYLSERLSWQQVIVVKGVTMIQFCSFKRCENIKRIIFADTVTRIDASAFAYCKSLYYIKLSISLRYVGRGAFHGCKLTSVFIPPRCRYIGNAFAHNKNLTVLNVPQHIGLDTNAIENTKLFEISPFESERMKVREAYRLYFYERHHEEINSWLKNTNINEEFALHRVCASFEPTLDMIVDAMKDKGGPKAFKVENSIGITPSRYLKENPYAEVTENEVIEKYVLKMMGEL